MKKNIIILTGALFITLLGTFIACRKDTRVHTASQEMSVEIPADISPIVGYARAVNNNEDPNGYEFLFAFNESPSVISNNDPNAELWKSIVKEAIDKRYLLKAWLNGANVLKIEKANDADKATYEEWVKEHAVSSSNASISKGTNYSYYIPSYAVAQTVMNYLKNQSCYYASTTYTPCITFGYIKDGCFARAHKMKQIMESQYNYSCYKIFSYGQNYQPTLRVSNGNCCVKWWYHVAPLVRIGTPSSYVEYVIDPSLFAAPVLKSTWLNAQFTLSCGQCGSNSLVTTPGDYYAPALSGNTVSYYTDNNYAATNAWLTANKTKTGCN